MVNIAVLLSITACGGGVTDIRMEAGRALLARSVSTHAAYQDCMRSSAEVLSRSTVSATEAAEAAQGACRPQFVAFSSALVAEERWRNNYEDNERSDLNATAKAQKEAQRQREHVFTAIALKRSSPQPVESGSGSSDHGI